jgi:16S rRNA C967 or C1407 C5-methylase (RsmB/RsmF family)
MYPDDFRYNLKAFFGERIALDLLKSLDSEPVVSIRRNPDKISLENLCSHFGESTNGFVPWCSDGIYLRKRPKFTLDPLFHSGAYYVQEASSMFIESLFLYIKKDNMRILDLCAAPGGKSTHICSLMSSNSLLVSNEVIRSRSATLAENIAKWGKPNILVTNNDPKEFKQLDSYFDLLLVDAPCSGEGMFRKDRNAVNEWSIRNVELCAARQMRILFDIWPALKNGGYLIYSTCTFNKYENDENIARICKELGGEVVDIPVPDGVLKTGKGGYQFIPGRIEGEGFFCTLIRKNGEYKSNFRIPKSKVKSLGSNDFIQKGYVISSKGEMLKAYPENLFNEMAFIESVIKVIHSGVAVATSKGKDLIPEADLALSNIINKETFYLENVTYDESLKFLAKEPLVFSGEPKGYLVLSYKNIPLGFVKNLGGRSNNLHPQARRIRMDIHKDS